MQNRFSFVRPYGVVIFLVLMSAFSLASNVLATPTVTLERTVYFVSPSGDTLLIDPGEYQVEGAEAWIRLWKENRTDAVLLQTDKSTHEEALDEPTALSVPGEVEDQHHVLLLLPDGTSFEAIGSYSGVRERGINRRALSIMRRQAYLAKLRAQAARRAQARNQPATTSTQTALSDTPTKRALVIFLENGGLQLRKKNGKPLPVLGSDEFKKATDWIIEEVTKAISDVRQKKGKYTYDRVVTLEDRQATAATLLRQLQQLSPTYSIDLHLLVHGGSGMFVGYNNERIGEQNLFRPLRDAIRSGTLKLYLNTVYMMNCGSGTLKQAWRDLGALAVNGTNGDADNNLPHQYFWFMKYWLAGAPFDYANTKAFRAVTKDDKKNPADLIDLIDLFLDMQDEILPSRLIAEGMKNISLQPFAGIWEKGSGQYGLVRSLSTSGFKSQWREANAQGKRLIDIEVGTGNYGESEWSGVFVQGGGKYALHRNVSRQQLQALTQQYLAQGRRLVDIEPYAQHLSKGVYVPALWSGVWREGRDRQEVVFDLNSKQFFDTWKRLSGQGYRLIDIETYKMGTARKWAGIFREGRDRYALYRNLTFQGFHDKWKVLQSQGLRLIDIETYRENGTRRWAGVWRAGSGGYALYRGLDYGNFYHRWKDLAQRHYRLIDMEEYR